MCAPRIVLALLSIAQLTDLASAVTAYYTIRNNADGTRSWSVHCVGDNGEYSGGSVEMQNNDHSSIPSGEYGSHCCNNPGTCNGLTAPPDSIDTLAASAFLVAGLAFGDTKPVEVPQENGESANYWVDFVKEKKFRLQSCTKGKKVCEDVANVVPLLDVHPDGFQLTLKGSAYELVCGVAVLTLLAVVVFGMGLYCGGKRKGPYQAVKVFSDDEHA
mmetsp:Transcript_19503/g.30982  ORF Transcript_19503/g.30982 Transcript_19503/m.30982 type:complete len:216 (-) Transcript_19503:117-764(-)|eukprot:CAMPEP_0202696086 /NCGR_PEP_ID=MMETSP1385-20130828/9454_1 /ASSEMBLY_ACC=CAM_ASM_000861 /TAXON_ID=933848 /ORGANISM="Elphidium margaritaceum" /LENGTH=215 /DNA_ID=CAMNT_0049352197 /DNA_START=122 /DNA_END=769 /DNA_ORIENTATION=-